LSGHTEKERERVGCHSARCSLGRLFSLFRCVRRMRMSTSATGFGRDALAGGGWEHTHVTCETRVRTCGYKGHDAFCINARWVHSRSDVTVTTLLSRIASRRGYWQTSWKKFHKITFCKISNVKKDLASMETRIFLILGYKP
jgi:hypothetical protein